MNVTFTARHFKASPELQQFAEEAVTGLGQLYGGIVTADIVLEDEMNADAGKIAEVSLLVYRDKLFAKERSDDFLKSIAFCVEKVERQLVKYKEKLHDGQHPQPRIETPVDDLNIDLNFS